MADLEDFDTRMRRLRDATAPVAPPSGLVLRVLSTARTRAAEPSWIDALLSYAKWVAVPAMVASVALAAMSIGDAGEVEEALYLAGVEGYLP